MIKIACQCREYGMAVFITWSIIISGLVDTASLTDNANMVLQIMKDKQMEANLTLKYAEKKFFFGKMFLRNTPYVLHFGYNGHHLWI